MNDLLIEREEEPGDRDFILASWLRSYRLSETVKGVDKSLYYSGQNKLASRILAGSEVKILAASEDPKTIVAWMCYRFPVIHYIYVKQDFRRMGLASRLLGDPQKWAAYTHKSLLSSKIQLPKTWKFDPYTIWCL